MHHSLVKALQGVPVFAQFGESELLKVVGASANLFWPAGSRVFERGSEAEALYIVLSGCVRIVQPGDGNDVDVADIRAGQFFGELSLMLETTHTRNAVAIKDTELMVLPKASFQELLGSNADVAAHFRQTAEERLASAPAGEPTT